jgi:phosphoesterase RecJ-like protein
MIASQLLDIGVNQNKICNLIYNSNSVDRLKFLGFALSNRLVVMSEYETAYFSIMSEDQKRFNLELGDTEGLVNYALSLKGISLAAIMIEKKDHIRISLRSIGDIYVNEIARTNFAGGGHKNAAGGRTELTMNEAIQKFESIVIELRHNRTV